MPEDKTPPEETKQEGFAFVDTPLNLVEEKFMDDVPSGIRDIAILDNKQQFLTACWINGETEEDRKASEAVAKYTGEILSSLSVKALKNEPLDYTYTSEIIAEAIRRTRADGINAPYLDMLEAMQPQKAEEAPESPDLFPDLPEDSTPQQDAGDNINIQEAQQIAKRLLMAQGDGYNRIRGITPKNSTISIDENKDFKNGEKGVKMERISRKGNRASVTIRFQENDLEKIKSIPKKWRVSAKMLMDYSVIKLTEQNNYIGIPKRGKGEIDATQIQYVNRIVKFPLEEWCNMRGIPDTKASLDHERQTVIEDCKTLLYTTLEWEERRKDGRRKSWRGLNPFPFAEVKNNEVKIEISTTLAAYLLTSPVMPYRTEFLRIDNRTPNAYLIATKLAELCNINGHRKARPSYIVSVSALLDATDYPTKEVVYKEMKQRYTEYIINPFLKAMQEIEEVSSLKWEFCGEGGIPLNADSQPNKKIDDFLNAYIKYNFTDEQALENLQEIT